MRLLPVSVPVPHPVASVGRRGQDLLRLGAHRACTSTPLLQRDYHSAASYEGRSAAAAFAAGATGAVRAQTACWPTTHVQAAAAASAGVSVRCDSNARFAARPHAHTHRRMASACCPSRAHGRGSMMRLVILIEGDRARLRHDA